MKTALQVGILVLVVIGGVGGLTFMSQYTKAPVVVAKKPADAAGPDKPTAALIIPERVAVWDPENPLYSAEFERGTNGFYDFWVRNPNSRPVMVVLETKGCTCSEVQLGVVPPAAWSKWQRDTATLTTALSLTGGPNLAAPLTLLGLPETVQWKTMYVERGQPSEPAAVPGADPAAGPQMALLRMKWEGRDVRSIRLSAKIDHKIDDLVETTTFEVPIQVVFPMVTSTGVLSIDNLNYNDRRETGFYCWSSTRPTLPLKVALATPDPCIDLGPARPLSPAELEALPEKLGAPTFKAKSGYFVPVTVHERRGGHQLDLGPLSRKITVSGGTDAETTVSLTGWVRSAAIQVGVKADNDRIDLGNFPATQEMEKKVVISSTDQSLELRAVGHSPDTLTVALKELPPSFGRKQWELTVVAPANQLAGLLPSSSSVTLETVTSPPRRIRIPVVGNATR